MNSELYGSGTGEDCTCASITVPKNTTDASSYALTLCITGKNTSHDAWASEKGMKNKINDKIIKNLVFNYSKYRYDIHKYFESLIPLKGIEEIVQYS